MSTKKDEADIYLLRLRLWIIIAITKKENKEVLEIDFNDLN